MKPVQETIMINIILFNISNIVFKYILNITPLLKIPQSEKNKGVELKQICITLLEACKVYFPINNNLHFKKT